VGGGVGGGVGGSVGGGSGNIQAPLVLGRAHNHLPVRIRGSTDVEDGIGLGAEKTRGIDVVVKQGLPDIDGRIVLTG
jgi:hypothetical protein